MATVKL